MTLLHEPAPAPPRPRSAAAAERYARPPSSAGLIIEEDAPSAPGGLGMPPIPPPAGFASAFAGLGGGLDGGLGGGLGGFAPGGGGGPAAGGGPGGGGGPAPMVVGSSPLGGFTSLPSELPDLPSAASSGGAGEQAFPRFDDLDFGRLDSLLPLPSQDLLLIDDAELARLQEGLERDA
jgi:hypothetical protein